MVFSVCYKQISIVRMSLWYLISLFVTFFFSISSKSKTTWIFVRPSTWKLEKDHKIMTFSVTTHVFIFKCQKISQEKQNFRKKFMRNHGERHSWTQSYFNSSYRLLPGKKMKLWNLKVNCRFPRSDIRFDIILVFFLLFVLSGFPRFTVQLLDF